MSRANETAGTLTTCPTVAHLSTPAMGEEFAPIIAGALAEERTQALQDAIDAIRSACSMCDGAGGFSHSHSDHHPGCDGTDSDYCGRLCPVEVVAHVECEYCGRPIAAIKALPGAPA